MAGESSRSGPSVWDAGTAGRGNTHYATAPAPTFAFDNELFNFSYSFVITL